MRFLPLTVVILISAPLAAPAQGVGESIVAGAELDPASCALFASCEELSDLGLPVGSGPYLVHREMFDQLVSQNGRLAPEAAAEHDAYLRGYSAGLALDFCDWCDCCIVRHQWVLIDPRGVPAASSDKLIMLK